MAKKATLVENLHDGGVKTNWCDIGVSDHDVDGGIKIDSGEELGFGAGVEAETA